MAIQVPSIDPDLFDFGGPFGIIDVSFGVKNILNRAALLYM